MMVDPENFAAIASFLGDSMLMVSMLIVLVLVLRKPVVHYFGAQAAYWLWLMPLTRAIMPPLYGASELVPERPMVMFSFSDTANAGAFTAAAETAIPQPDLWALLGAPAFLLAVWLAGAIAMFGYHIWNYAGLVYRVHKNGAAIGDVDGIRIIATPEISGPVALGSFRKLILVPSDFNRIFNAQERDLVLQHEFSHHRSGDLILNFAAFILLCAMWFNPLAWMGWRAFRQDQESACDARVLAGQSDATKFAYGRALARGAATGLPVFATAMHAQNSIVHRIRRLTMMTHDIRRIIAGKLAIIAAAVAMLPLTATYIPAAAEEATKPDETPKILRKIVISKDKSVNVKGPESAEKQDAFQKTVIGKNGKRVTVYSDLELSDADVQKLALDAKNSTAIDTLPDGKTVIVQVRVVAASKSQGDSDMKTMNKDDVSKALAEALGSGGKSVTCDAGTDSGTKEGASGSANSAVNVRICGTGDTSVSNAAKMAAIRAAITEIRTETAISQDMRDQAIRQMENTIKMLEAETKS